jgi:ABC-type multidrug transport system ATPase subunit
VKRLKSGSAIALTDSSNNLSNKIALTIMPNIYIIGGPKGAGKTTVFLRLLPNFYFENVLNMSMQMRGRNVLIHC